MMPELPPSKREPIPFPKQKTPAVRPVLTDPGYVELHCRSNFTFLEGASHPDELINQAAELGLAGLALTDKNSLAGVVRAHVAAKSAGVRLIIGAEITPTDADPVVLWVINRAGYAQLCRLISTGRRRAPKGECQLTFADIAEHADGLLAGIVLNPFPASSLSDRLADYHDVFADRCHGLAELRCGDNDAVMVHRMKEKCRQHRVPIVAAGDVYYHHPNRQALQDVLTAIRHGCTVSEAGPILLPNAERHLHSAEDMLSLFAEVPEAVRRTLEIADRCRFSLDELRYEYPEELVPTGETPIGYLQKLAWKGAHKRYPAGIPDKVRSLLDHELNLIERLRYEAYFLTVWDLVRFARSRGLLCQGRGSAANSAVCYCLGVTSVDPDRFELLFERFISVERDEAPDIDIDFENKQGREEVLQYIYDKYGRDRAGMTAVVVTYRLKSAVRDVGKALGLSLDCVDKLAGMMEGYRGAETTDLSDRFQEAGFDEKSSVARQLLQLVSQLLGFPRHLGQHVGGMVMTRGRLCELVPIENAAMSGRTVVEWDKDDLDALGILKVDCLALGMLSAIHRCFDLIERHYGRKLQLATVPAEDKAVYRMIRKADTIGVFQIESRAQMSMLPRLRPKCFYDLVIEVAIVRPGPIQGEMVHPYLRRRNHEEPVEYPSPAFEKVLSRTLGVPLFQEQVMALVVEAAGFTPGEADLLRRAMAAWKRKGGLDKFRCKVIDGFVAHGLTEEMSERIFKQIRGFGEYGFPESHAASFALLVYVSAWLKCYYPAAFTASILNCLPMGFYAPAQLVRDAKEHGVEVRPADINASDWFSTLESTGQTDHALRLGLRLVNGIGEREGRRMEQARKENGPFASIDDLAKRCGLNRKHLSTLAAADAFASLQLDRRQSLWNSLLSRESMPLFSDAVADEEPILPKLTARDEVRADYRSVGLTLRSHPISFLRTSLDSLNVVPCQKLTTLRARSFTKVAGLVTIRQQPQTAKGIRFITLEDETGIANLVVRQSTWHKHRQMAAQATALLACGTLERRGLVIHVVVSKLENLTEALAGLRTQSRDFR